MVRSSILGFHLTHAALKNYVVGPSYAKVVHVLQFRHRIPERMSKREGCMDLVALISNEHDKVFSFVEVFLMFVSIVLSI